MNKYVKLDDVIQLLLEWADGYGYIENKTVSAIDELKQLPTKKEIIRCKDCMHWDTTWGNDSLPDYHYCFMMDGMHRDDFYCAEAERREE